LCQSVFAVAKTFNTSADWQNSLAKASFQRKLRQSALRYLPFYRTDPLRQEIDQKMKHFTDFKSYNEYLGLDKPLDNDIDVGYYDPPNMLSKSEPISVDFYRISIKINLVNKATPKSKPITAVFFNSPNLIIPAGWDVEPTYTGMYLQLSKKFIEENRYLFKTYLDYGQHEALYLSDEEVEEISAVFKLMMKYYESEKRNFNVLLSYVNVVVSLVEAFYKRQF